MNTTSLKYSAIGLMLVLAFIAIVNPAYAAPGDPTIFWVGGSGDWNTPSNWNTGLLPGPNDDVLIDRPGISITVTHSSGSHVVSSLLSQGAFVLSGGSLTVTNTVQVNAAFTLSGGTLKGAMVLQGTNGLGIKGTTVGGTLDAVTVNGDLDLTGNNVSVTVVNGLTLNGTATIGATGGVWSRRCVWADAPGG
ncbi:MAG: hypothetical protein DME26_03490 [Verrucomicrobia bacterium]|nr:MAG: hypothetical protein DME26_03490 [Verrucomicrobiota bacterium]